MGLPLVTRAEYKAYMGISSTTSDAAIDALIPKVSDLVKTICRRTFIDYVDEAKVEYHEGGGPSIDLSETPVLSISSLEYSVDYGQNYTVLEEYTNYVLSKATNSIKPILINEQPLDQIGFAPYGAKHGKIFPQAINGYIVTYTAGYLEIPQDLKLCILDIIAYYLKNDSSVHTHKNVNPNTMQIEYLSNTHFPAHIKRILDLYTASYD